MDVNVEAGRKFRAGLQELLFVNPVVGAVARALGFPVWDAPGNTASVQYDPSTDKITFRIDPSYIENAEDDEVAALIAHETFHVVLDHLKEVLDPIYTNQHVLYIAQECIINDTVEGTLGLPLPGSGGYRGMDVAQQDFSHLASITAYNLLMKLSETPPPTPADDSKKDDENKDSNPQGSDNGEKGDSSADNGDSSEKDSTEQDSSTDDSSKSDSDDQNGSGKDQDEQDSKSSDSSDNDANNDSDSKKDDCVYCGKSNENCSCPDKDNSCWDCGEYNEDCDCIKDNDSSDETNSDDQKKGDSKPDENSDGNDSGSANDESSDDADSKDQNDSDSSGNDDAGEADADADAPPVKVQPCHGVKVPEGFENQALNAIAAILGEAAKDLGVAVDEMMDDLNMSAQGGFATGGSTNSQEPSLSSERMNWRSLLAKINPKILESGKRKRKMRSDWTKHNRRLGASYPNVILPVRVPVEPKPSKKGDSLPVFVVALDLSGSIPRELVGTLQGMLDEIPEDLIKAYPATWGTNLIPYVKGGKVADGWTNFNHVVDYVKKVKDETGTDPYVLVITDGAFPKWNNLPGREWFWMSVNKQSVGTIVNRGHERRENIYLVNDFMV